MYGSLNEKKYWAVKANRNKEIKRENEYESNYMKPKGDEYKTGHGKKKTYDIDSDKTTQRHERERGQNYKQDYTTKSRAYIALAYAISGSMNIAPPDWSI